MRSGNIWSKPEKRDGERPIRVLVRGTDKEKELLAKFPGVSKYVIHA